MKTIPRNPLRGRGNKHILYYISREETHHWSICVFSAHTRWITPLLPILHQSPSLSTPCPLCLPIFFIIPPISSVSSSPPPPLSLSPRHVPSVSLYSLSFLLSHLSLPPPPPPPLSLSTPCPLCLPIFFIIPPISSVSSPPPLSLSLSLSIISLSLSLPLFLSLYLSHYLIYPYFLSHSGQKRWDRERRAGSFLRFKP